MMIENAIHLHILCQLCHQDDCGKVMASSSYTNNCIDICPDSNPCDVQYVEYIDEILWLRENPNKLSILPDGLNDDANMFGMHYWRSNSKV